MKIHAWFFPFSQILFVPWYCLISHYRTVVKGFTHEKQNTTESLKNNRIMQA